MYPYSMAQYHIFGIGNFGPLLPNSKNMKLRTTIILLIILLSSHKLFSQSKITRFKVRTTNIQQYELAEWDVDIKGQFNNPYLQEEVALDMIITSPTGKELVLPCF